ESWRGGPAVFVGDTNSGRPGIDEESPAFNRREGAWIDGLDRAGGRDAFRHFRGRAAPRTEPRRGARAAFRPRPPRHPPLLVQEPVGEAARAMRRVQLRGGARW